MKCRQPKSVFALGTYQTAPEYSLRSSATSIFNWGRVVSMTAPSTKAPLADAFGCAPMMSLASVRFPAAAMI